MAIEVELPDGNIVEFPDGTDNGTMERALAQYRAPAAPAFGDVRGGVSSTDQLGDDAALALRYAAAGINPRVKATDGESFLDNAAAGFGAAYVDTKDAVRQLAAQGTAGYLDTVNDMYAAGWPGAQFAKDAGRELAPKARQYERQVQGEIDERKRLDAPLKDSGGGATGGVLGFVSQLLMPAGALRGVGMAGGGSVSALANLGARALLPATIRGSAAQGAALGALQPVATGESRGKNAALGGAFGAGGAALGRGIGAAARGTKSLIMSALGSPTPNAMVSRIAQLLRAEAQDPARLLTAQPSGVPGVQRTLAEESLDSGIARLERLLRSKGGTWGDLDRANNNARVDALARFAGDKQAVAAAERARSEAAMPLLRQAFDDGGLRQENILRTSLGQRPKQRVDMAPVLDLLKSRIGANSSNAPVQSSLNDVMKSIQDGIDTVASRYGTRKFIDNLLSGKAGGDKSYARAASRELMQVKEALDEQLAQASPAFAQYLEKFRSMSAPIGRMQIGQDLLERGGVVPDAVSGNTVLTPAQFSKAARDLDQVAAKATGFKKAEAGRYLTDADTATIGAIQDDLQRRSFAATAGSGGNSQTAERLMGNERLARSLTGRIADRIPLFGAASQYLRESGQQRLEAKLAEVLMNPGQARSILAAAPAEDRRILQAALGRAGSLVGATTAQSVEQ